MCLIGMVAAVDDSSTVSAQVKAKITISDVGDVDLGSMYPINTYYSPDMPITVESNKNWQVDATASNNGLMTDATVTLGHNMMIKLEGTSGYGSYPTSHGKSTMMLSQEQHSTQRFTSM